MKIAIITEESGVEFVTKQKEKRHRRTGRGIDVSSSNEFITQLKMYGFTKIPSDDTQNERAFKSILHEYIKPAQELYAGRFREVMVMANKLKMLKRVTKIDVFIISGRYGLVKGTQPIIPYKCYIGDEEGIKRIYQKFRIHRQIPNIINLNPA